MILATQKEPKVCPQCGRAPSIMPTLFSTYYVACAGHHETKGCDSKAEAIALWNRDEYEELPPSAYSMRAMPAGR